MAVAAGCRCEQMAEVMNWEKTIRFYGHVPRQHGVSEIKVWTPCLVCVNILECARWQPHDSCVLVRAAANEWGAQCKGVMRSGPRGDVFTVVVVWWQFPVMFPSRSGEVYEQHIFIQANTGQVIDKDAILRKYVVKHYFLQVCKLALKLSLAWV